MDDSTNVLNHILEPMATFHDPAQLRKVAHRLKQMGGEDWACGETLERAVEHLFGGGGQGDTRKRPMGFDEAYGSMTFPLGASPGSAPGPRRMLER